ncbi:MAG TPA: efflux RND transporter periplasmic adaptor subunit [Gemmatimonadales bacterium]|nr:efflux RND transporter periplasmic adaptor subunit [Gemmatimonadales bacterium]
MTAPVPPPPDLSRLRIDRDAPSPALKLAVSRNLLFAGGAVVLLVAVLLILRPLLGKADTVQVVVATPTGATGSSGGAASVTANGYVVARTHASVSSKVPGRLAYLGVSEGSFVHKGDVIARLESADFSAQVAEAEANMATAQAQRVEAEADRDQLQREAKRLQDIKAGQGGTELVSPQDLDAAVSKAAQAEARARAAVARVTAAEAGLRFAHANLDNTIVRAPFTGTVLRKDAEVGEVVAPSVGGGLTRGAVVTMADLGSLEVEVDVNEAYIGRVHGDQPARVTLDAYPDTAFRAKVRQVVPTADRQRATVQVKVSILDHDPRILPEMAARVDFLEPASARAGGEGGTAARRSAALVFRLPAAAIREQDGRTIVWLVRQGRLEPRPVDAGPVSGDFREVRGGLTGGEQILVGGVATPKAGMRVRVATP